MKGIDYFKKCVACENDIPIRKSLRVRSSKSRIYGWVYPEKSKFCSRVCSITYRNKYENPAQTINGREKIRLSAIRRGTAHLRTPEALAKLSKTITGNGHWNWKGNLTHPNCIDCNKPISFRRKRCRKCSGIYNRGERASNWQGGKIKENKLLRKRQEVINWRKSVFERDDYTCRKCGDRNRKGKKVILNAHHIKPWAKYRELRHNIDNGITLCEKCHKLEHQKNSS